MVPGSYLAVTAAVERGARAVGTSYLCENYSLEKV